MKPIHHEMIEIAAELGDTWEKQIQIWSIWLTWA